MFSVHVIKNLLLLLCSLSFNRKQSIFRMWITPNSWAARKKLDIENMSCFRKNVGGPPFLFHCTIYLFDFCLISQCQFVWIFKLHWSKIIILIKLLINSVLFKQVVKNTSHLTVSIITGPPARAEQNSFLYWDKYLCSIFKWN